MRAVRKEARSDDVTEVDLQYMQKIRRDWSNLHEGCSWAYTHNNYA